MKDLTIVCIDTRRDEAPRVLRTLEHCSRLLPSKEVIFFTNEYINSSNIKVVSNIQGMNNNRMYDFFILSQLVNYITTSHYLIVQTDGYILNSEAWSDIFLSYDYIGAPWRHHPYHEWPPHTNVSPANSVGNGGFSLRSRKLGSMVRDIFCKLSKKPGFTEPFWYPEDCFICRDLRSGLEKNGIVFAPEELARKFSCENTLYTGQFGFHGKETMKINKINYL